MGPWAAVGAMISTPSFVFGAKFQKRIVMACDLVHYYNTVGHDPTAANLQWNMEMKNSEVEGSKGKERRRPS